MKLINRIKKLFAKNPKYHLTKDGNFFETARKNWGGEKDNWECEKYEGPIENCPFKEGEYFGYDVVFGALTGKLEIKQEDGKMVFTEWTREFDGRAPLYFKSPEDFKEQIGKMSTLNTLDGFYF